MNETNANLKKMLQWGIALSAAAACSHTAAHAAVNARDGSSAGTPCFARYAQRAASTPARRSPMPPSAMNGFPAGQTHVSSESGRATTVPAPFSTATAL